MEHLNLPMVNLTPTMRCNLRCRLCGVLVPQYEYRPHMTLEEFSRTLKAVFEVVDHVGKLQITGGEPLLHTELPKMLELCFEYVSQFDTLWIFTNCAVPIKPQLMEVLEEYKDRVFVHASDYGVKPNISIELQRTLEENKIPFKYLKYFGDEQYFNGWVDQGDFIQQGRTETELKQVFSKCSHVNRGGSWYVRGGQMHWCGRSIRGVEVGKIPVRDKDYLDIFVGAIEERKDKLRELIKAEHIIACDYCNGYYGTEDMSRRVPAGRQI